MTAARIRAGALAGALGLALAAPAARGQEQHAVAFEAHFQGYSFEEDSGVDAVNLLILPVGYRLPVGERLVLDFYGAWARGQVESQTGTAELQGLVDTQVKARFQATPWALLSVSASLPTGLATHDSEQALVAGVLSSDLLGFRESVWGNGFGLTTGVATATRVGGLGMGIGASYRLAGEFEPEEGDDQRYRPGNEVRVRVGIDHGLGESGKVTAGFTFQNFSEDQAAGRNFFQAGNRFMADVALGFRAGGSVWTVYGMDLWRERGDLSLAIVDQDDQIVGDTTVQTATQNLLTMGITGTIPVGSVQRLRVGADVRLQGRGSGSVWDALSDPRGGVEGSGWIGGFGLDLPIRLGGSATLLPSARVMKGSIEGPDDVDTSLWGAEGGLILRLELGR